MRSPIEILYSKCIISLLGITAAVASELLKGGANLNARTKTGDTAAHYAARHGTICALK